MPFLTHKTLKGMKDSLNQAKDLKAYVTGAKWNGKTRCLLSYLDLIIQYNSEMVEAFEGHTKALKELDKSIQTYGDIPKVGDKTIVMEK